MCDKKACGSFCQDSRHKLYVTGTEAWAPSHQPLMCVRQREGRSLALGAGLCLGWWEAHVVGGVGSGTGPLLCELLVMVRLAFPYSHRDTTAKIEATARRALVASNTSYALLWSLVEGRVALEAQRELEDR